MGQFRLSLSKLSPRLDHRAICRVRCRSVAAAGDLLFFASPKKPKEKKGDPGVCVPFASLRGNLRCSVQPGSRANSLRSNKHEPFSVWPSAPRRIHKGGGPSSDSGSIEPASWVQSAMLLIAASAHID